MPTLAPPGDDFESVSIYNSDKLALVKKDKSEYFHFPKFPHLFLSKKDGNFSRSDTSGSLTLHRVQMNFGTVGIYNVDIQRFGKDDYTLTIETTEMDGYDADRVAGYPEQQFTIPVYDRSENTLLTMKSDHPTPATLLQMTFEGEFTENYYKNV